MGDWGFSQFVERVGGCLKNETGPSILLPYHAIFVCSNRMNYTFFSNGMKYTLCCNEVKTFAFIADEILFCSNRMKYVFCGHPCVK